MPPISWPKAVRLAMAGTGPACPASPAAAQRPQTPRTAQATEMIRIGPTIAIAEDEIGETFIRASGPGGQHVNKVSTAVQLRFNIRNASGLPPDVRARLERLGGARVTRDGVLVLTARAHRSQERNRQAAREALIALVARAAEAPRKRRPTAPTLGSKLRRLADKARRSTLKQGRGAPPDS
jgi:ribosome-associated protein